MKKYLLLLSIVLLLFIGACSSKETKNEDTQGIPEIIEVHIQTEPEMLDPGKPVAIQAIVTQGSEPVDDAQEVKFEIWKKGQEDHEKIEGKYQGKGIYSTGKAFDQAGIYYVIAHVTAREMHNMPKKELTVGCMKEEHQPENQSQQHDHDNQGNPSTNHHGSEDIRIHLMKEDEIMVNQETSFTVHLQKGDQSLAEANVRLEIWKGDEEQHQYVETKEIQAGEYKAPCTFTSSGSYHLKIHVKKGDLHEHQENTVQIQS